MRGYLNVVSFKAQVGRSFMTRNGTDGNTTHTSLYVSYLHSIRQIEIVGTTVIPELPSKLLMARLLILILIGLTQANRREIRGWNGKDIILT
jgi:hypothetical protein